MIPVYWVLVILPLPLVLLAGFEAEWERWGEIVRAVADSPFQFVGWIGGGDWNTP